MGAGCGKQSSNIDDSVHAMFSKSNAQKSKKVDRNSADFCPRPHNPAFDIPSKEQGIQQSNQSDVTAASEDSRN